MEQLVADVLVFHKAGAAPVVDTPTKLPVERTLLRTNLHEDEHKEILEALIENDPAHILQECLDVIYVAVGTLLEAGLQNAAAEGWRQLIASNNAKINVDTGMVRRREDGKILKPEGWKPVDWQQIVDAHK